MTQYLQIERLVVSCGSRPNRLKTTCSEAGATHVVPEVPAVGHWGCPLGAVAVGDHLLLLQWNRGLFCGQDFLIVGGDDLLHVWAGGVRELQVLPVEDLAQGPILGEAFVDQGEESCSNVGCRTHRVPT